MTGIQIRDIHPDDAGEVLTIQRAAFVQEAQIYGSPDMPPLTQTLEELRAELEQNLGCVALAGPRIGVIGQKEWMGRACHPRPAHPVRCQSPSPASRPVS